MTYSEAYLTGVIIGSFLLSVWIVGALVVAFALVRKGEQNYDLDLRFSYQKAIFEWPAILWKVLQKALFGKDD